MESVIFISFLFFQQQSVLDIRETFSYSRDKAPWSGSVF